MEIYTTLRDLPAYNYHYFCLYYRMAVDASTALLGEETARLTQLFNLVQSIDDLKSLREAYAADLTNIWDAIHREKDGIPYEFKAFDCLIDTEARDTDFYRAKNRLDDENYSLSFGAMTSGEAIHTVRSLWLLFDRELSKTFANDLVLIDRFDKRRRSTLNLINLILRTETDTPDCLDSFHLERLRRDYKDYQPEVNTDYKSEYLKSLEASLGVIGLHSLNDLKGMTTTGYYALVNRKMEEANRNL